MRIFLVRHAAVTVREDRPSAQWHLSQEGRSGAQALACEQQWAALSGVHASSEPKAIATAQRIAAQHGRRIRIDRDLREVERPWEGGDYRGLVRRYLAGEVLDRWEPQAQAGERVHQAISRVLDNAEERDVALVSHGLVLTIYLADLLGLDGDQAYHQWERIAFPDMAVVDPGSRRLELDWRGAA
jgi:broad specificity phosphatase PhoE